MKVERQRQVESSAGRAKRPARLGREAAQSLYVKGMRSAVTFYKKAVKRPDIKGILEDLSNL